jgi:hypothetical protein
LKRQIRSDDRLIFRYNGDDWVVHEPWGDNSRYWIGPKNAENHCIDVTPIHEAFIGYHAPVMRLWSAVRKAVLR